MIDIHSHILPGLDDGPATLAESLEMCRIGYDDGIRTIVATPHTLNGIYQNDRSTILTKVRELNDAISNRQGAMGDGQWATPSVQPSHSLSPIASRLDFIILPGADAHLCEGTLGHLTQSKLTTVDDGGKFLLIEFPSTGVPHMAKEVLRQLIESGITPIITHPERNLEICQNSRRYYAMIRMGCLGQVTAVSLTGRFGPKVKRIAEKLLSHRLIHFIASDAHSANGRPPVLSLAVEAASKKVGKDEANKMVTVYPQAILQGRKPDLPTPIPL